MLADLKVPGFCCFFPCFLLVPLRIDYFSKFPTKNSTTLYGKSGFS